MWSPWSRPSRRSRPPSRTRAGWACSRRRPRSRAGVPAVARGQHRELTVTQVAAPDLAAIIQRGFPFSEAVVDQVRAYCAPLHRANVDTVILGCTHYPLVRPPAANPRPRSAAGDRGPRGRGYGRAHTRRPRPQRLSLRRGLRLRLHRRPGRVSRARHASCGSLRRGRVGPPLAAGVRSLATRDLGRSRWE